MVDGICGLHVKKICQLSTAAPPIPTDISGSSSETSSFVMQSWYCETSLENVFLPFPFLPLAGKHREAHQSLYQKHKKENLVKESKTTFQSHTPQCHTCLYSIVCYTLYLIAVHCQHCDFDISLNPEHL